MIDPADHLPPPGRARPVEPARGGRAADLPKQPGEARLRASAIRFEAAFLAEMLRHAGLGKTPSAFNGGAGEAAFSGTLIQEYATRISEAGGIGIADRIFQALLDRSAE
jgi:Rod binding domain-containing protein